MLLPSVNFLHLTMFQNSLTKTLVTLAYVSETCLLCFAKVKAQSLVPHVIN